MSVLFYIFAAATAIAAVLATIAIWAPRRARVRIAATAITTLFLPIVYAQVVEVLGKPKPVSFEWYERNVERAALLGVSLEEGKAIYLWLRLDGSLEPRAYVVPWSLRLAEKLEDAVDEAVRRRAGIVITKPFFKKSLEEQGDLNIEIRPPPTPPLKGTPPPPPQIFNPREKKV